MQKPKVYKFNAARFDTLTGFYTALYRVIPFLPDYKPAYNLDALHDVLYSGFGKHPVVLIWKHAHKSRQDLGIQTTRDFYQIKIDIGKPYNIQWANKKITALENGKGETLFEILLDLFSDHKNIKLILN